MERRTFLQLGSGALAASLLPDSLLADTQNLFSGIHDICLECLGDKPGLRYLDGHTRDGSVGLAQNTNLEGFSGTRWHPHANSSTGQLFLECRGEAEGPRFLDGRTLEGKVGLAPNTKPPFTGTLWQAVKVGDDVYRFQCLGRADGPRWLNGNTLARAVDLAPTTDRPFTGTNWRVRFYPAIL